MKNWMTLSLKRCWEVSVAPLYYSPGTRRKKKETQMRFLITIFICVVTWASVSKAWITLIGRGRTLVGGESSF